MTKATDNLVHDALHLHELGFCVIPTRGPRGRDADMSKKPTLKAWKPYQQNRPSEEQIRRWSWPGIGVVCGAVSGGLVVLDVDGKEGEASVKGRHMPITVTARTPNGTHCYYHVNGDCPGPAVGLLPGVDLRGEGSYVVAPPSQRPAGEQYTWFDGLSPDDVQLAPMPGWLHLLCEIKDAPQWVKDVAGGVEEGRRDDTATRLAGYLLGPGGKDAPQALKLLLAWNRSNRPPLPDRDVRKCLKSIARKDRAQITEAHLTDTGNAERLIAQEGKNIRYCYPWAKWLVWTGRIWQVDAEAQVLQLAKRTVGRMYSEAAKLDGDKRSELADHALRSESAHRRRAMVFLAQSEPGVACDHTAFDTDPWLLNCRNGTLDLRNGNLRHHHCEDYITRLAPVEFDAAARCPKWIKFLDGVFDGNRQLVQFVQRAAGYSLTGDVSEDSLFFLHGTGANGKTTLFLTLQELLGPYAIEVSPGLLLTHRYETHPTGLADLFAIRLAVSVEVGEGRRFDEERLKQITGGDRIRARRMREDFGEFPATHKIWLAANEKPKVTGQDYAIWRRIKLIPFNVKFTDPGERGPDKDLSLRKTLFRDERPGILTWALEGCLSWQADGLAAPAEVQNATAQYKTEEDVVQQFIEAECVVSPEAKENPTDLFKAYERWRKETGAVKLSSTTFGRRLTDKGFESGTARESGPSKRWRTGITLAHQPNLEWEN